MRVVALMGVLYFINPVWFLGYLGIMGGLFVLSFLFTR